MENTRTVIERTFWLVMLFLLVTTLGVGAMEPTMPVSQTPVSETPRGYTVITESFNGKTIAKGSKYERIIFDCVDFNGSTAIEAGFSECIFRECKINDGDWSSVCISKCKFMQCSISNLNLDDSVISESKIYSLNFNKNDEMYKNEITAKLNTIKDTADRTFTKRLFRKRNSANKISLKRATLAGNIIAFTRMDGIDLTDAVISSYNNIPSIVNCCDIRGSNFTNTSISNLYVVDSLIADYDMRYVELYQFARTMRDIGISVTTLVSGAGITILLSYIYASTAKAAAMSAATKAGASIVGATATGSAAISTPVIVGICVVGGVVTISIASYFTYSAYCNAQKSVLKAYSSANNTGIDKILDAPGCVFSSVEGIDSIDIERLEALGAKFTNRKVNVDALIKSGSEEFLMDVGGSFGAPGRAIARGVIILTKLAMG